MQLSHESRFQIDSAARLSLGAQHSNSSSETSRPWLECSDAKQTDNRVVLHSMRRFLPVSENWLYPQATSLQRYQAIVMARKRHNADQFPFPPERMLLVRNEHGVFAEKISTMLGLGRDTPTYCYKALSGRGIDIMHSHFGYSGYTDLTLARKLNVPHIVTFYGCDLVQTARRADWRRKYRRLFRQATLFVVEGPYMKQSLLNLGCPPEKVRIRYHGVNTSLFEYVRRPCNHESIRILIAARFAEKKGVPDALQAVARVMQEYPQVSLTLVGDARPDKVRQQGVKRTVLQLLQNSPLKERTEWLGAVSFAEFGDIVTKHDIFVQASCHAKDGDCEGGAPVSLTQVAATGMPIVAARHCDIPEIVVHNETGLLVPERDVDALADAIRQLITCPELRSRFGMAARQHVCANFTTERTIMRLESIYDEALVAR